MNQADESIIVNKYKTISEHINVPKADAELTVEMNWSAKDTSKIKNTEEIQTLYETEKSHPGLTSDVYSRFAYKDIMNTLLPILYLNQKWRT